MEDDILNNVDMGGVGTNIANTEAVFAFSLSGKSSMTKAGEITEGNYIPVYTIGRKL